MLTPITNTINVNITALPSLLIMYNIQKQNFISIFVVKVMFLIEKKKTVLATFMTIKLYATMISFIPLFILLKLTAHFRSVK